MIYGARSEIAQMFKATPITGLCDPIIKWYTDHDIKRGMPTKNRFAMNAIINKIATLPTKGMGIIHGTSAAVAVVRGKLYDDELQLYRALNTCAYRRVNIGNLKSTDKAQAKRESWCSYGDVRPNDIKVGPCTPETLDRYVSILAELYKDMPIKIVISDSGSWSGYHDYKTVAKRLTEKYPNVYIMAVVIRGYTINAVYVKDGKVELLTNSGNVKERYDIL